MKAHESTSPEATRRLAATLAGELRSGDVILLRGDLGAGKTEFVKGLAEGLAATEPVTSPTFTLMNVYAGSLTIYHFDLYRLECPEELENIGFGEFIEGKGLAVVEWPDRFPAEMPDAYFKIDILPGNGPSERRIHIEPVGDRYEGRLEGSDWN